MIVRPDMNCEIGLPFINDECGRRPPAVVAASSLVRVDPRKWAMRTHLLTRITALAEVRGVIGSLSHAEQFAA